jgi:hypothetical protein
MSGGLGAAQQAAGLGGSRRAPRYGMHAFHVAASLLIDQGVSPERARTITGHSSIGVTFECTDTFFQTRTRIRRSCYSCSKG